MNGKPTAAQKRLHDILREKGCVCCLCDPSIHHIKGARMRLKGVSGYAGEWYVLPLCYKHHQGEQGIHTNKKQWEKKFTTEKLFWVTVMENLKHEFGQYPMTEEEYQIIVDRA